MPKAIIINKSGVSLHGVKPGGEKVIDVDSHGVPKEQMWRRRIKDSKLDGCVDLAPVKTLKKEESSK